MIYFSVIIPTYNSAKTIKNCISSVLSQKLKNIEIICVDDGSKDRTVEYIKKFKNKKIKIIQKPHSGQPNINSNLGIKLAKGKYICFLDSDDIWVDPRKLIIQLNQLRKKNLYSCCTGAFNKKNNRISVYQNYSKNIISFYDLSLDNIGVHSSLVVKKNVVKKLNYLSEHKQVSTFYDFDFKIKLSLFSNIAYIPLKTVQYLDHQKFSNRRRAPVKILMLITLYQSLKKYFYSSKMYLRFHIYFLMFCILRATRLIFSKLIKIF